VTPAPEDGNSEQGEEYDTAHHQPGTRSRYSARWVVRFRNQRQFNIGGFVYFIFI
jgi:hypothetical protein